MGIFASSFLLFLFFFSFIFHPFDRNLRSYLSIEVAEVENFLSIFSSYLKLGFSSEKAFIASCQRYEGLLKNLINDVVRSSIYSGGSAKYGFLLLAQRVKGKESRRLLQLFSHAMSRDLRVFGDVAFKLIMNLKRNRVLKHQVDLLFSRMKIRVSLISLVFSAVLAMVARLFPIILLFMTSLSGGFPSLDFRIGFDEVGVFIALGVLSFVNTYFVSIIVFHDHPLILSFASLIVYVISYLLTSNLMRGA